MTIDPNIVELINADVDGEISPAQKQELEAVLTASPEAKAMHAELLAMGTALDELPDLDPPPSTCPRRSRDARFPGSRAKSLQRRKT